MIVGTYHTFWCNDYPYLSDIFEIISIEHPVLRIKWMKYEFYDFMYINRFCKEYKIVDSDLVDILRVLDQ